jgi:hypothetical protein
LIVHKNAACCRLTGIDAHLVVGKPASTLLSISKTAIQNDGKLSNVGSSKQIQKVAITSDNLDDAKTSKTNPKNSKNSLNKLIATSGFGEMHRVLLHTKQQKHMVGQNVTIKHSKSYSKQQSEDSNDTSLTSNSVRRKTKYIIPEQETQAICCQISVAPIVVSTTNFEKHESTKRTKHNHQTHDSKDSVYEPPEATHFVIQIAPWISIVDKCKNQSNAAFSSNSIEEQIRLTDKRSNMDDNVASNSGGSVSLQSSDLEAIVAIG